MYFVIFSIPHNQYIAHGGHDWGNYVLVDSRYEACIFKESIPTGPMAVMSITSTTMIRDVVYSGLYDNKGDKIPITEKDLQAHEVVVQFVKIL